MKKILIVDDEPIFLALLEGFLNSLDCKIIKTTEGNKVSELIETEKPDLLITDIFMPGKDGIEIIHETRLSHPQLPIIIVTNASQFYLENYLDFDPNDCFSKPFDQGKFLSAVSKYI